MGRRLTVDEIAAARQMILDGATITDTATIFGVTRKTLRARIPDITVPMGRRLLTDTAIDDAWADAVAGESLASIAARHGVSYQALQQQFKRRGFGVVADARLGDDIATDPCPHDCGRTAGHLPADAFNAGGVSLPACQGRRAAA